MHYLTAWQIKNCSQSQTGIFGKVLLVLLHRADFIWVWNTPYRAMTEPCPCRDVFTLIRNLPYSIQKYAHTCYGITTIKSKEQYIVTWWCYTAAFFNNVAHAMTNYLYHVFINLQNDLNCDIMANFTLHFCPM